MYPSLIARFVLIGHIVFALGVGQDLDSVLAENVAQTTPDGCGSYNVSVKAVSLALARLAAPLKGVS